MEHYTTKINKIKVKNIPRLCTILNGFNLDIYNYDTERQKFIIREIEALKKIL